MRKYTFTKGQLVQFTARAKESLEDGEELEGTFIVLEARDMPLQAQLSVGHHQHLLLERHDKPVSGIHLEPATSLAGEPEMAAEEDMVSEGAPINNLFERFFPSHNLHMAYA